MRATGDHAGLHGVRTALEGDEASLHVRIAALGQLCVQQQLETESREALASSSAAAAAAAAVQAEREEAAAALAEALADAAQLRTALQVLPKRELASPVRIILAGEYEPRWGKISISLPSAS
jgi:hypothetical protein